MGLLQSQNKCLSLSWCFLAAVFLFNPNFNIIDVLPDFIGYFFLVLAFSKLGELNESVAGAVSAFRKMILVDLGKWLVVFWVFGMSVPSERNSSLLLWSFVFATVEMLFAIPAFMKLFGGLTEIGFLYPNESLLETKGRKSRTDRIKGATVFLVAAKGVLYTLPELSDLTNTSYDETGSFVNLYRYIGVMRLLAFLPMLIIGVVWMVRFYRYFNRLKKDRTLWDLLCERYRTEVLPRTGMFIRRNFHTSVTMILVGLLLTLDFRLERVNMLPDFLAALVLILAVWNLKKYLEMPSRKAWLGVILYLIASSAEAIAERYFFANYTYYAVLRSAKAGAAYGVWIGSVALKNAMLLLAIFSLIVCLRQTVRLHTGYVVGKERVGEKEEKMVAALHRELNGTMIPVILSAVLYAAADVCYPIFDRMVGFMGLIQIVCALICVLTVARALFAIRTAVDTKYMLS